MKKQIIAASLITALLLSGCSAENKTININVENNSSIVGTIFGKSSLAEIGDGLQYDTTTRIVYWWNGWLCAVYASTAPSPYYAPNGLPYRYNPETNTFEEINLKS